MFITSKYVGIYRASICTLVPGLTNIRSDPAYAKANILLFTSKTANVAQFP